MLLPAGALFNRLVDDDDDDDGDDSDDDDNYLKYIFFHFCSFFSWKVTIIFQYGEDHQYSLQSPQYITTQYITMSLIITSPCP